MKRIAILVSGSGSNMQAVIDACAKHELEGEVVLVLSSNAHAGALDRARRHGIDSVVCALETYGSRRSRDEAICTLLDRYRIDLVVLAGYLGIVTDAVLDAYAGRIINIHPSLLPKYGGREYYGIKVHQAVLEAGETHTGATVHYVDKGTDTGPVIRQVTVAVRKEDTPQELQERVLMAEHRLLVDVLKDLCKR